MLIAQQRRKSQRSSRVALLQHNHVHNFAFVVDRAPDVDAFAGNRGNLLVQTPTRGGRAYGLPNDVMRNVRFLRGVSAIAARSSACIGITKRLKQLGIAVSLWTLQGLLRRSQYREAKNMSHLNAMLGLIDAWKAKDIDRVLSFMHEEIVWHYAAAIAPPLKGKEKARKFLEGMAPQVRDVTWRIFDYAERGDRLFVEGVDEYVSMDGHLVSAPYAGVVEVRDGKIIGLREYFDLGVVNAQKAGDDAKAHVRALIAREAVG